MPAACSSAALDPEENQPAGLLKCSHGAVLSSSNDASECTVAIVRGASLAVEKPAVPFICTGHLALPADQPVGAAPCS